METKNAIITAARITSDDHGMLTAWLTLDYGGSGQGFGGYALYLPKSYKHHLGQANYAGHFIWRVLEIADVTEWSKLVGKTIRVSGAHGHIETIGHIIKDDWFNPKLEFDRLVASANEASQPAAIDVEEPIYLDRLADYVADNWPDKKYTLEDIAAQLRATWPGSFLPADRLSGEAGEAGTAVAQVPIHPRHGPLWSDTLPIGSELHRSNSYPMMALYTATQAVEKKQMAEEA